MPVKKDWKKVEFFPSKSNYELYIESHTSTSISTSNQVKCQECKPNIDKHKMRYCLSDCVSSDCNSKEFCNFKYRTHHCLKNER